MKIFTFISSVSFFHMAIRFKIIYLAYIIFLPNSAALDKVPD